MRRIAEKLEFMSWEMVKVCVKAGRGRKMGAYTQWFCGVFQKKLH